MPCICSLWAAARKASFTDSALAFFSVSMTKSMIETVGVGTRSEVPSNLPLSSGMTSATAFAAPVLVGMMFCAAARGRRGSLCGPSSTT